VEFYASLEKSQTGYCGDNIWFVSIRGKGVQKRSSSMNLPLVLKASVFVFVFEFFLGFSSFDYNLLVRLLYILKILISVKFGSFQLEKGSVSLK
jgi:hypothetical protein